MSRRAGAVSVVRLGFASENRRFFDATSVATSFRIYWFSLIMKIDNTGYEGLKTGGPAAQSDTEYQLLTSRENVSILPFCFGSVF